ncbi:MAG TPA: aminotransferase class I/II-fold pyridoxal phosphate-dependent enzyme [Marmoricola sp.]|nr:aminotransferase class I/II-fold pyridoxal phosphate-dependent enzyme [Marmoricola sp.]
MKDVLSAIEERLDDATAKGLAAAVSRAVNDGALPPGSALPPIRTLAHELTLSPTTVSAAWAILGRAGAIRTAGRRGSFVAPPATQPDGRYRQVVDHPTPYDLDLSTGVPDEALLPSLRPALRALTTAGTPRSYLDDPVLPELRELLLGSWPYPAPALTLVDGALDGLELTIRVLLRYGDRVVVEHPTFPPLLDLLEDAGAEVVGVPIDDEGLEPDPLADALAVPTRAVFLQPRAHNPTGVSLTTRRVRALARVLRRSEAVVVEDDSTSAISRSADVSLGTRLPERTVHLRSFSKSHGPDLRLAAISGPEDLMGRLVRLRQRGQGWSSRLLQRVLLELLSDEATVRAVDAAAAEYARRRGRFVAALAGHGIEVPGIDGLNVWVPVRDETAALVRLAAGGIGVAPGAPFRVLPVEGGHVRVTAGLLAERLDEVAEAVAVAARTPGRRPRTR